MATQQDYTVTKDGYIAFDSASLKEQINTRLANSNILTDQSYSGSNISAVTDIIAFTFHSLMYYLNRTSSESMFSLTQIYENMNRIVKAIDYKPIGFQTSTLSFKASATDLLKDLYTIPRYSYIDLNNIPYSFNEDVTFAKNIDLLAEELTELSKQKILFQGKYIEHPIYNATGTDDELIYMVVNDNTIVDHFNIDIYVKPVSENWIEYQQTPSLYLENAFATKYEIRFNENKRYEIKFGNNINGRRLNPGDQVAIYYLESLGTIGEVGAGALSNQKLVSFNTIAFNNILNDIVANQYKFLTDAEMLKLSFYNDSISTYSTKEEAVADIRKNAPTSFRSQYRLVVAGDYKNFIKTNFANLIQDVQVVNNTSYITQKLKYYFDLGITKPNRESRVLFNQVNFSDACNFNNIYVTAIPRVISNVTPYNSYLTPSQKELILSSISTEKTLTAEIIIEDPVYVALDFAFSENTPIIADVSNSNLIIVKDDLSRRDNASIKAEVQSVFNTYFNRTNTQLGQLIDINGLTAQLISINGVKTFYTGRTDNNEKYEGLSLMIWNPVYKDIDLNLIFKNITLPYFKYPYFNNLDTFINRVQIINENTFENVDI